MPRTELALMALLLLSFSNFASAKPKSSAVGWGNLIVPGLGATFYNEPGRGLGEAAIELGTFYGGSQMVDEGRFTIDGSISLPDRGSIQKPVEAKILQQIGLKYHFYNTFYHYQRAVLDNLEDDFEKKKEAVQPIYRGGWKDIATAPFRWENISSPWAWPAMVAVSGYVLNSYAHNPIKKKPLRISQGESNLLLAYNSGVVPYGSAFGEDVLFRGFMQREIHGATDSLFVALVTQSTVFASLHDQKLEGFLAGMYYGLATHELKGNLGPVIAVHFWLDSIIGLLGYWQIRREAGQDAPTLQAINYNFTIPF